MKGIVDFLTPLGLTWLGLTWLAFRFWRRRKEKPLGGGMIIGLWLMLTLTCWTSFPERLLASLERPWAKPGWEELPQADVLLFLGGGAASNTGELLNLDMGNASDRLTTAIELMRRGKAPVLVAGGGQKPSTAKRPSEGVVSEHLIRQWKLFDGPIYQLGVCANTHEEALAMKKLTEQHGWKSVLLVTSASHMRRSVATFQKQGINVIPAPCGFRSKANSGDKPSSWISPPDAGKIELISIWIYEKLGYAAYAARDWL